MSFIKAYARWLPTFLAFPLGGLIAITVVGSVEGPVSALLAGALAGAVVGAGQWLALRSRGIGRRWIVHTSLGMALGSALASALTDSGTATGDLVLTGLVTGTVVGLTQSLLIHRGAALGSLWTVTTGAAWAIGWLITSNVIVDAERAYVVFGSSGALVATALIGLLVPRLFAASSSLGEPAQITVSAITVGGAR